MWCWETRQAGLAAWKVKFKRGRLFKAIIGLGTIASHFHARLLATLTSHISVLSTLNLEVMFTRGKQLLAGNQCHPKTSRARCSRRDSRLEGEPMIAQGASEMAQATSGHCRTSPAAISWDLAGHMIRLVPGTRPLGSSQSSRKGLNPLQPDTRRKTTPVCFFSCSGLENWNICRRSSLPPVVAAQLWCR